MQCGSTEGGKNINSIYQKRTIRGQCVLFCFCFVKDYFFLATFLTAFFTTFLTTFFATFFLATICVLYTKDKKLGIHYYSGE